VPRLHTRLTELEAKLQEPGKDARNSGVPPAPSRQATIPRRPPPGTRREASVGRAGGGRPLHPNPDQVIIAQAQVCPPCGAGGSEAGHSLQAVYDRMEGPPVKPIITRVEQYGGRWAGCGQPDGAPVPTGREPGTPFGASVQSLATSLRSTHAISYERLSARLAQVFGRAIREGGLAPLLQAVKGRLDQRVAASLPRLQSSRLIGSDDTSARVHGQQPWEWVFQNREVCLHVSRPSRGQGVSPEVLGAQRPTLWVSARSRAQQHPPAEAWQVCVAHHVRDGQFAIDAGDAVLVPRMKAVFLRALASHTRRDTLAASTLYQSRGDLQRRVHRGLARQPTHPHGRRLQQRSAQIQDHGCLWLDDAPIPPTHNSSAQAIRMRTVLRKVTNGVRADWGRDLCAAVRSVVNTGKRRGLSAFHAIQQARSATSALFAPG
jgi:transposase